ncbi:MAG TPA: response regulator transcription factor [Acidimicrobiales bacterium]|nr:response regulator transcription factor [Acidimicrobiales bacterium]
MATPIRVLIVDDEALVRVTLGRTIGRQADMLVIGEAGDGPAAIALVEARAPDVVVMDVTMPGPSGIETALELRARGIRTPILFFTGDPGAVDRAAAIQSSRVLMKAGGGAAEALAALRQLASAAVTASMTARAPAGLSRTRSAAAAASSDSGSPDIRTMRSAANDG